MKRLFDYLTQVRATYPDTAEQQIAHRLLIINLIWAVLFVITLPITLWTVLRAGAIDALTIFIPVTLALSVINHQLIQRGALRWARTLFVANLMAVTLLGIFPNYRIDTPFVIILTLPITAASALLGRNGLLTVALAITLIFAAGGIIQSGTGMQPTPLGTTLTESIWFTIVLVVIVIFLNTLILRVFGSGIESALSYQHTLSNLITMTEQTSETLVSLPAAGEALNNAVEQFRDAFGLYHVQIFLVDPQTGQTVMQASTGFIGRRLLEEESLLMPAEDSPINDALRQSDPVIIHENAPESQRTGFLPATRSELLLPLRVGSLMPIGVLDMHSTAPNAFPPDVLDMLKMISNQLAIVIYSSQQTKDLRANYQEREQLVDQINAGQRELARTNRQLVGATWGVYMEEHRDMLAGLAWQKHGGVSPSPANPGGDMLNKTLEDGKPRLEIRGSKHVLSVPIRLRGQVLGALEFQRSAASGWSSNALELAQAVAERLALSLENARLFEQAQATAEREKLVSQITSELQSSNDLQTLLSVAAAQFQDALGATQTQIRLGTPPSDSAAGGA